jgi:hypothetical protein
MIFFQVKLLAQIGSSTKKQGVASVMETTFIE